MAAREPIPNQPPPAPEEPPFPLQTPLAKKLWALRQELIASGAPLLSDEEIDEEVRRRRGGIEWPESE